MALTEAARHVAVPPNTQGFKHPDSHTAGHVEVNELSRCLRPCDRLTTPGRIPPIARWTPEVDQPLTSDFQRKRWGEAIGNSHVLCELLRDARRWE